MTDTTSKGEQARAEIMEAAKRLFFKFGYGGTSMRDIAKEAGERAVAGIYNHFGNKEAIFEALLEEKNLMAEIENTLIGREYATAPDYVRYILTDIMKLMPQHQDYLALAQIDIREFQARHISQMVQARLLPQILSIIRQMQTLPGFKPIDPAIVVRLLASTVIGYLVTQQFAGQFVGDPLSPDEWIDQYIEMILHGLALSGGSE